MDYRRYVVALREFGRIGPKTFQQILLRFGSLENIFFASVQEISELPQISRQKAESILAAKERMTEVDQLIESMGANDQHIVTLLDESYPELLRQIGDPPLLLYYKGGFPAPGTHPSIAIIGATEASQEGIAKAVALGKGIASRGGVVVSGLARGIDSAAHLGALANHGTTYAVLGSGLDSIYPPENVTLAENVAENGAILSEYSPKAPVTVGQLIARNRTVVGLSQAVILVEESLERDGRADAAQKVLDLGRPLFVASNKSEARYWQQRGGILIEGEEDLDLVLRYL